MAVGNGTICRCLPDNPNMEIPVGGLGPLDSKIMIVVSRLTVQKHFEVEVRFDFVQLAMEPFSAVSSSADCRTRMY